MVVAINGFVHDGAGSGGPKRRGGDAANGIPTYFDTAAVAPAIFVVVPTITPLGTVTDGDAAAASDAGEHLA